ncbi:hypothetical protein PV04_06371 [Phialophora macrospora]|uniref:Uncharacterized protein n=1 Tax=Phialophora macrospora TaxID=1851006 RepID=A0A0D2FGB5_9EURO|nr:hypothetical protein PV04_06371 [Phialophora macrospora]
MPFDQNWASGPRPVLPRISDLLGDRVTAPLLPPLIDFSQRPYPSRSHSFPMLRADRVLLQPSSPPAPCRGPTLHPIAPDNKSAYALGYPTWNQMPSPPLTVGHSSSVSSMDTDAEMRLDLSSLERTLSQGDHDFAAVAQSARNMLENSEIEPAYTQGWFQPDNEYSKRLEEKLHGMKLPDLVEAFFYRDETRALYGDRVIIPRKSAPKEQEASEFLKQEDTSHSEVSEKLNVKQESQKKHGEQEEARRNRHRSCQHDSHARCPEVAASCGAEHAKSIKETRTQAGKGPGKDEQLYAAIYTQEMAARLVQALNDRCIRAETTVRLLLQTSQQPRQNTSYDMPEADYLHFTSPRALFDKPSYVGLKRGRGDDMEDDRQRAWTRIRCDSDGSDSRGSSFTD